MDQEQVCAARQVGAIKLAQQGYSAINVVGRSGDE